MVAEHVRGRVREVTYELIAAGVELGGRVTVASIAAEPAALDLSRDGVDEIIHVRVDQTEFETDIYEQALETLIKDRRPDVTLLGFTVNSMCYGPAVAAKLNLGYASDIFAMRYDGGTLIATRAFYGSKVHAELDFEGKEQVLLLLRPTAWRAAQPGGSPRVSEVLVPEFTSRCRHLRFLEAAKSDVDISTADFLLAIGRGIGPKENLARFEQLAEKIGAILAVSRPLVDAGWVNPGRQVGQSGHTVNPKVYLAMGISGAVQHLAGMKASRTIIAINTDPEAAIFNVAQYGAVADLFEVAEELGPLFD